MTGEITLRGKVTRIGGLKEKALAAYRQGITEILIPKDNAPDIDEIPAPVRRKLNFTLLEDAADAFEIIIEE